MMDFFVGSSSSFQYCGVFIEKKKYRIDGDEPNSFELTGSNYSGISLWTQTKQNKPNAEK